jgi:hypothetical protein
MRAVSDSTVNDVDGIDPKSTPVAPVKFTPVTVTVVPPVVGPDVGDRAVTAGRGETYVNMSPAPWALVPVGVVTVTTTGPAGSSGEVAVIDVFEFTAKTAATDPNATEVAPVRFDPVMVTDVPPPTGPELGLTSVTVGTGTTNVNVSAGPVRLVPLGVVTVMSTGPADSAGEVALIDVAEFTTKVDADDPKSTTVAPVNPVPVMVTDVSPLVEPERGLTRVTVGSCAT